MKIYTKGGDKGLTSLYGGTRVEKTNEIIGLLGKIDKLNSSLGIAVSFSESPKIKSILTEVQENLFVIGTIIATPEEKSALTKVSITQLDIQNAEEIIDNIDSEIPNLENFILPGGCKSAAFIHDSRSICREVEIAYLSLQTKSTKGSNIGKYLNRLSDLLFVVARYANLLEKKSEIPWKA